MAKNNTSVTLITGNNYGGQNTGQVNAADETNNERIRSWLSPLNFWQKQNDTFSSHHPGTGQWFLDSEQFRAWVKGKPENLCCYGSPGSGKTVLASFIVDHLRKELSHDKNVGVAVVYCQWTRQEIQTPAKLLAGIWDQLSLSKPLAVDVQELYGKHVERRTEASQEEVHAILRPAVESCTSVYLVIDALDELTEQEHASSFFDALIRLAEPENTNVCILTTSRSDKPVLPRSESIRITAMQSDIERFVEDAIAKGISWSSSLSNNVRENTDLKQVLVQGISKQADGLFLLARLFVQSLRYKTNLSGVRDSIRSFPADITMQYQETWQRIEQQNFDHSSLAKQILQWLCHAVRPLTVEELRHALAVRSGDRKINSERLDADAEELFVHCCHGFVMIEAGSKVIGLVHYTAQQYLDARRSTLFPLGEANILQTCLTYLSFTEFNQGPCKFESLAARHVNKTANGKCIARKRFLPHRLANFPFMTYAATNWGRHAEGENELAQKDQILAFLRTPMLLASAVQVQDNKILFSKHRHNDFLENLRKNLPLIVATSFGLDHIAAALLSEPHEFDINFRYGILEDTLLHNAVEMGNVDLTRVLLDAGADPQIESTLSYKVLYQAIAIGHDGMVDLLLSYGHGMLIEPAMLYCATFTENKAALNSIMKHSRDSFREERLHQIFFHAACLGRVSILELAMEMGAEVNAKDAIGQTALFIAIKYGRVEAVDLLLRKSACVRDRNRSGLSPLQLAVSCQEVFAERLRFVQHYGLDYRGIPNQYGGCPFSLRTPMVSQEWFLSMLMVWFEDCTAIELVEQGSLARDEFEKLLRNDENYIEIIKSIVAYGGDITERDSKGRSLLHLATYTSNARTRMILGLGRGQLEIDAPDNNGRTPLHYAAAMGFVETMKLLVYYGADIETVDQHQATTLHFSVNSAECTDFTINEKGSLITALDYARRSALHYASLVEKKDNENDVVKSLLIMAGVGEGTADIHGKTALYYDQIPYGETETHLDVIHWIQSMNYDGHDSRYRAIFVAVEKSHYYKERCRKTIDYHKYVAAKKRKTWTIVSNSEEEDFDPSTIISDSEENVEDWIY